MGMFFQNTGKLVENGIKRGFLKLQENEKKNSNAFISTENILRVIRSEWGWWVGKKGRRD